MRILYSHYLASDDHPAVQMVRAVAAGLRQFGHEVRVHRSAGPPCPPPSIGGNTTGRVKRTLWFARAVARNRGGYCRDAAAIAAFDPDVVLCRQDAYRVSMPMACARAGVPLVTYADAPVAYESRHVNPNRRWHPPGVAEAIEGWGLRRSRAVVTVGETAARLLGRYRLRVPVVAAPNGVDVSRFRPFPQDLQNRVRPEIGVTTRYAVGFVGSFRPFHGLRLLGDLIREAVGRRADATWVLVGDGPGRRELEARTAGCRNVRFLGHVPPDRVAGLLPAFDVLVAPRQTTVPEHYFCPLKVLEAMASGVACLAADQGDVPFLLDHGRAGRVVTGSDPKVWADALDALLDRPDSRAELAAAARRRVVRRYTWVDTAAQVESALLAAVGFPESGSQSDSQDANRTAKHPRPAGVHP